MGEDLGQILETFIGFNTSAGEFSLLQMLMRAAIVYLVTLAMVRFGEKRFLGKSTAFDIILGIIIGSVVSRGINSTRLLMPTLAAGLLLILMHWAFAAVAFRSDSFGDVVKGNKRQLVKDGEIQWDQMRAGQISEKDLLSAIRTQASKESLDNIQAAYLERSGDISVIPASGKPKIIEVQVADGVQTVRIKLE